MPTIPDNSYYGWTTSSELAFIAGMADSHNAVSLLQGYLAGMRRRTDFIGMDSGLCVRTAQRYLDERLASSGANRFAA